MSNFNKVILVGNLMMDPELYRDNKGEPRTRILVTVHRHWTDRNGEEHDEDCVFAVVARGRNAEIICESLEKGNSVLVDGRLRSFTNLAGHAAVEVVMEGFRFLPGYSRGPKKDDTPKRCATCAKWGDEVQAGMLVGECWCSALGCPMRSDMGTNCEDYERDE